MSNILNIEPYVSSVIQRKMSSRYLGMELKNRYNWVI